MKTNRPIKLLDSIMINKISAGEVVERPSSVVKELVDNSIDAGATAITIEISDGIIRVSDNGSGIPKDQVEIAFVRHATSKIENIDDLENILTMGFRGEAMAAISSVSNLELVTKYKQEDIGSLIQINGGKIIKNQPIGAASGTSVIVRDLFYNVPARLKFLKKPATEVSYVTDIIEKFALANPNITFNYITNSKKRVLGGKGLKHAIYDIYGKEYYKDLLDIDKKNNNAELHLTGYIGKPVLYRSNRSFGNVFINTRYIKSKIIQTAVEDAYKTKLPIGQFPVYALNLSLDPKIVDVNVHPTKLEVRFQNEDYIYNFVKDVVFSFLTENTIIPEPKLISKPTDHGIAYGKQQKAKTFLQASEPVEDRFFDEQVYTDYVSDIGTTGAIATTLYEDLEYKESKIESISVQRTFEETKEEIEEKILVEEKVTEINEKKSNGLFKNYKIIGTFFDTYIVIEDMGEVFILDQHAAHERIWYDKLLQQIQENKAISQGLVSPVAVNLTATEEAFFLEHIDSLKKLGFDIEEIGQRGWAIRAVPFVFESGINPANFLQMIDDLKNIGTDIYDNNKLASIACKAAVKGGDKLSSPEIIGLIEQLENTQSPYTCPHGRPTIIKFTKYEIEKMFKRKL